MAVPTWRQTRTNLLIPPPVSRVHRGINALPVVVEMPLWGIGKMVLVRGLPQQPPSTLQNITRIVLDVLGVRVVPPQRDGLPAPRLMTQTITHVVNALLDGIHGTHSVVYTQGRQQGLQQVIHSRLTDPEVDHVTGQQEVSLAIEGGPRMGGINGSTIGRQAGINGTLGVVGSMVRGSNGGTSARKALDTGTGGVVVRHRWRRVDSRGIGHRDIVDEGSVVVRTGYAMPRMAGTGGRR
jgi:hypothetical protein